MNLVKNLGERLIGMKSISLLQGGSMFLIGLILFTLFLPVITQAESDWKQGALTVVGGVALAGSTALVLMLAAASAPVTVPAAATAAVLMGAGGFATGLGVAEIIDDIFDESSS